jgi:hypothetical protein
MTEIGVYAGNNADGIKQFETWLGRDVDFISTGAGRASWSDWQGSILWAANQFRSLDTPLHWTIPMFANGGNLTVAANGDYDARYLQAAKDILAASAGQDKIVIRVGEEFNGNWMTWSAQGHEREFVQAFHHFVDTFRSVSDKFVFEWNVAVWDQGMDPATAYPGDDYVDIIGGDFYYSQWFSPNPDQAWSQMVNQKYGLQWLSDFATSHGKPMGFSEWGVQSDNAQSYITNVAKWFASHNVAYQSYWNSNAGFAGQLSQSQYPGTAAAFLAAFGATVTKIYAGDVLTSETITYASGPDISDTKEYTTGTLSRETVLHSDGSKDVFMYGILNKSYVSEHDTYNAAGKLSDVVRAHADNSLDYTFHLASDGTTTTDQYDASGLLKIHSVVHANGSSAAQTYAGGSLIIDAVKFAPGSADLSDTKSYANGVLTRETIVHANGSKDDYHFNISGKSYIADHDTYSVSGSLSVADLTLNDGTHAVTAYATGATLTSNTGTADVLQSWSGGKDVFVFNSDFGKDTINGFHAGNGTSHDVILLDANMVTDYSHLQIQQAGHDTLITIDADNTILLTGVSPSNLTSANFAFVHHDLFV